MAHILGCFTDYFRYTKPMFPTGTHSYNLSKYLVFLLHNISVSPFMISDTFPFLEELHSLNLDTSNIVMASFDVPLDETVNIITYQLIHNSTYFLSFLVNQFKKLLCFAIINCRFLFNGNL